MTNKIDLLQELLRRKTFSVAAVQAEFGVGYKELRNCVRVMEENGQATLTDDGLTYAVNSTPTAALQTKSGNAQSPTRQSQAIGIKPYDSIFHVDDDDDDGYDKIAADRMVALRRRELMERLARIEDDDDDDDDDDEDEEDEWDVDFAAMEGNNIEAFADEANDCKLIDGINYGDDLSNAQKIADRLAKSGYKVTLRAIQYGTATTGYVFDYPSQKKDIKGVNRFVDDIRAIVNANEVKIVAPWSKNTVYILARHDAMFDALCKRALKYWLVLNKGRASIASAQLDLGIRFNHAAYLMHHLQKLGCVESLSPSENASTPTLVRLTAQEIDILFPKSLGWE